MGVCKKPTTLSRNPPAGFFSLILGTGTLLLRRLKKKKARNQNISPLAYRKNALAAASQKLM